MIADRNRFFAIADGVGGLEDGAVASRMAVTEAHRFFRATRSALPTSLREAVISAGNALFSANLTRGQKMATTLTAVYISDAIYFAHVGDCRIYYLSDEHRILTMDHVRGPAHAELTKCLGLTFGVDPDCGAVTPTRDFSLLLCSDGFYSSLSSHEIFSWLSHDGSPGFEELVAVVKSRIPGDNYTGVLIAGEAK